METKHSKCIAGIKPINKSPDIPILVHEIKNLLAGISGATAVLFEDIPPDDPKKEIINEIVSQIGRLDRALKELLGLIGPVEGRKDA